MAHHYGINRLMALVHPENYCVLHWMKKLEAFRQSKNEWCFLSPYVILVTIGCLIPRFTPLGLLQRRPEIV